MCVFVGGLQDAEMPHTPYRDESDSEEEEEEIAAVEMFLETYFMHCDNTYNKLQTLCEQLCCSVPILRHVLLNFCIAASYTPARGGGGAQIDAWRAIENSLPRCCCQLDWDIRWVLLCSQPCYIVIESSQEISANCKGRGKGCRDPAFTSSTT